MKFPRKTLHLRCGVLFFLGCRLAGAQMELAHELFAEGDWPAARREAARAAAAEPGLEEAQLLDCLCVLRQKPEGAAAEPWVNKMEALSRSAASPEVRGRAALEAGRWWLQARKPRTAWPLLKAAFVSSAGDEVTLSAGAELLWLGRHHASWLRDDPTLALQLASLRQVLWRVPLTARASRGTWTGRPGAAVVRFYRKNIRPVIGSRCLLEPSCSEYFLQASHRHGWRGLPMVADRLVREPGVVRDAAVPVMTGRQMRYADPLKDHTFWWKSTKEQP